MAAMPQASTPLTRLIGFAAFAALACLAAGCEEKVVATGWGSYGDIARLEAREAREAVRAADAAESARDGAASGAGAGGAAGVGGEWTIALDRFEGPGHAQQSAAYAQQLAQTTGMNVWAQDELGKSVVYSGRYKSPNDRAAQADLQRWQQLSAQRLVRVPAAMIVPVTEPTQGASPQYDLRTVRGRSNRGFTPAYSLQIAFYDAEFGPDYRQAAEQAVAVLRQDGAEAYYFHGPVRSSVTLGTFAEESVQIVNGDVVYAQPVQDLQKKYPHNLANGRTLQEKRGGVVTTQGSFLVRIPE